MSIRRGFWFVVVLLVAGLVVPVGTSSPASAAVSGSLKRVSADSTVLLGDTAKLTGRFATAPRKRWVLQKATIGSSTWKTTALKGTTTTTGNLAVSFKPTGKAKYRARLAGTSRVTNAVSLPAVKGWRRLSAGYTHTCGIAHDRSAWCWGRNTNGQLGDPALAFGVSTATARKVALPTPGARWADVQAGSEHSCGLLTDHTLWCWGDNTFRQLGLAVPDRSATPRQVPVATGQSWMALSVGLRHSCALRSDRTLWCWGSNARGQLTGTAGNGGQGQNQGQPLTQVVPSAGTTWRSVSAGDGHTCATRSDHKLLCWGTNTYGQLGPSALDNTFSTSPVVVPAPDAAKEWTSVSAGTHNTCASALAGGLWCWGGNERGQLGTSEGMMTFEAFPAPRRQPAPLGAAVLGYEVGKEVVCALSSDRSEYCWGNNLDYQLGVGETADTFVPDPQRGPSMGWRMITTSFETTCGLARDHRAWCWGGNEHGQTGSSTSFGTTKTLRRAVPNPV